MTAGDFKRYIAHKGFNTFNIDTADIDRGNMCTALPLSVTMRFNNIRIELQPPTVLLKADSGTLSLENVKNIELLSDTEAAVTCRSLCRDYTTILDLS